MRSDEKKSLRFSTLCIHGSGEPDTQTGSVTTPIYQTSTFAFQDARDGAEKFAGEREGFIYTRISNPTVRVLERQLALLEEGEEALFLSSGMAAIVSLILAYTKSGENIISSDTVYGGTYDLFKESLPELGIEVRFVNALNLQEVEDNIDGKTRFIFLETPANPSLSIIDIRQCAEIAHHHGVYLVVDNTFATPCFQKPLLLNADFVVHSATKYLGGHSDLVAGAIIGRKEEIEKIRLSTNKNFGPTPAPFTAWLVLRGLKTLQVRMERHQVNAFVIARFLENHPEIERVFYPGLPSHPQHELARDQMSGYSGMISFLMKGGRQAGEILMNSLRLITLAVSLGGVESLIEHPASMTHSGYSAEDLKKVGISEGLVRLSVGLEDPEDLIADLKTALNLVSQRKSQS